MAKRHSDAIAISDGACNPSGICHSIIQAQREIIDQPGNGTNTVTSDPAVRLMVHQLAFLCGIPTGEGIADWEAWRAACEKEIEPS